MKKLLLISLLAALWSQSCHAQKRPCSLADSEQADREASKQRSWNSLYRSYHRFAPRCDDGSIAEGYSNSVVRILVDHWDTLPRLSELAANHQGFESFVLRHVDATVDGADLDKIRAKASHSCPAGQNDLCRRLRRAADRALKEPYS